MFPKWFQADLRVFVERRPGTAWAIFGMCCACCYLPWIYVHLGHLWRREHYQFFPMFLVALGMLGFSRLLQTADNLVSLQRIRIHVPLLLLGLMSLAAAFRFNSPSLGFLSACSLLMLIARNIRHLPSVVAPLFLLLPLPFALDVDLVHRLQRISSTGASALLDSAGVHHLMSGNVLEFAEHRFFVAEACSGIGSVFMLLASASLYAVWRQHGCFLTVFILLSAVGWAVAANTFRIFFVALSYDAGGPDFESGFLHDMLGSTTYFGAMLLILCSEQVLLFILDPVPASEKHSEHFQKAERIAAQMLRLWNRTFRMTSNEFSVIMPDGNVRGLMVHRSLVLITLSCIFTIGGVAHAWGFCQAVRTSLMADIPGSVELPSAYHRLNGDVFSNNEEAVEVLSFRDNPSLGHDGREPAAHCRKIWELQIAGKLLTASLCGPFDNRDDLHRSFESGGWKILESGSQTIPETAGSEQFISEMTFYRGGEQRHVLTAVFGESGLPVAIAKNLNLASVRSGLGERLMEDRLAQSSLWHFQVSIRSDRSLDDATRTFWLLTFRSLFQTLLTEWRKAL